MSTHGVDVSRYQETDDMDGWSFVIVNVEDPGLATKINHAKSLGIPWGVYTWIYPGKGAADMGRAVARTAGNGDPPLGYWLDYEQLGVTPADLDAALAAAKALGVFDRTGVYTYLHSVTGIADHLQGRPLWLAYYPGNNDGTYLEHQDSLARHWGAVLWQYTSGANASAGLDRNVVIDDAWYEAFTTGDDLTPEQAKKLDDLHEAVVFNLSKPSVASNVEWTRAYLGGVPGVFPDLATRLKTGADASIQVDAKEVAAAIVAQLGPQLARDVRKELAEALKD